MIYPNRLIKKGETDASIVHAVQQQLISAGITNVIVNSIFDNQMVSAVKQFQSQHTDINGNPLIADGVIGPITWEILFLQQIIVNPITSPLLKKVLQKAVSQIGVMEQPPGSNRGPEVEKYLRSVGLGGGYAWCMAFIYWVFDDVCKAEGIPHPLVKTGGVLNQWNQTTQTKILVENAVNNPSLIKPGAIFIINHGGGFGHAGIVEEVNGGILKTIEGNTNNNQSREGVGVFRLNTRKINSINKGFILPNI
jgi:hypothetical protein